MFSSDLWFAMLILKSKEETHSNENCLFLGCFWCAWSGLFVSKDENWDEKTKGSAKSVPSLDPWSWSDLLVWGEKAWNNETRFFLHLWRSAWSGLLSGEETDGSELCILSPELWGCPWLGLLVSVEAESSEASVLSLDLEAVLDQACWFWRSTK